jgi:hypothetical protein
MALQLGANPIMRFPETRELVKFRKWIKSRELKREQGEAGEGCSFFAAQHSAECDAWGMRGLLAAANLASLRPLLS